MSITGTNNPFACDPVIFTATNSIVALGTITRVGNSFTFSVGFVWKINGTIYQNAAPITITVAEADAGYNRIDNAILNTSNSIELQQGLPSNAVALQPVEPENAILLTSWDISGASVSEEVPPILGNTFLQKEFEKSQVVNASGTVVIPLNIKGRNNIILYGTMTGVNGFSLSNLDANPANAEYPHEGKDYYIQNKTGHNVTLKHFDTSVDIGFISKDGNDIVVPNNGIVSFKNSSNFLEEIFRNWSKIIEGTKYTYVYGNGSGAENGTELQNAYNAAKTILGLNSVNRFKIIVGPGKYEYIDQFIVDTEYIDIVSLTGDADIDLPHGISVIANDVYLKGIKTGASFELSDNLDLLKCENCIGGPYSFGYNVTSSGKFINCAAGSFSFGSGSSSTYGTASGIFINCLAKEFSFGRRKASGYFKNCEADDFSFGALLATGNFFECMANIYSFGGDFGGELTGKLYSCFLKNGTFQNVINDGRTYHCIDGNGDVNNQ